MRRNYTKFVNDFLNETGMTGADLARAIGVTPDTIQRLRRGNITNPQYSTKKKINQFILKYKKGNKTMTEQITPKQTSLFGSDGMFRDIFKIEDNHGNTINMIELDGKPYTTSRMMAEYFEKDHKNLLRIIDRLKQEVAQIGADPLFIESTYTHDQNKQEYREILVSEDGCMLYMCSIQGYTAEKWAFIQAFRKMEQIIREGEPVTHAPQPRISVDAECDYLDRLAQALLDADTRADKLTELRKMHAFASVMMGKIDFTRYTLSRVQK